jgi:PAS domain S-box-containing protein
MGNINELFASLPGFAWRTGADGHIDAANPGVIAYVGALTEDLRSHWLLWVHPDDRGQVDDDALGNADMDEYAYKPVRFRRHDGVYRWFQCSSRRVRDGHGGLQYRYRVGWDIHEVVIAAEEFRRQKMAIAAIVDCIPGFVWQLGSDGELNYLNAKVFAYTGKTLEQLRDPGWRDSVHPEDVDTFVTQWTRAMQGTSPIVVEFRLRRFDGAYRWFRTTGEPVMDANHNVISWCGVDIDIDDEKQMDQTLRRAQAQLARTAQLAIAAELTASTANAINQPLAAIVANSFACQRWLAQSPPAIERAAPILDLIVNDSKEAANIVSKIMTVIRRTPPADVPQDLNIIIGHVLRLLEDELQASAVAVHTATDSDLGGIRGDAALIQEVLVNIIRNSLDALKDQSVGPRSIAISAHRVNTEIVLEVSDNGGGFTDGAPLFEAFYTTKSGGLGLGLAIARSIVESYGGRTWAQHRQPVGATIGFSLPASLRDNGRS